VHLGFKLLEVPFSPLAISFQHKAVNIVGGGNFRDDGTQFYHKRLSINDVRTQEELTSADILRTRERGVLQMRMSVLFDAKTSDFSKLMACLYFLLHHR